MITLGELLQKPALQMPRDITHQDAELGAVVMELAQQARLPYVLLDGGTHASFYPQGRGAAEHYDTPETVAEYFMRHYMRFTYRIA